MDAGKNEIKKQRGAAHRHEEIKMLALEQRRELAAEILVEGLLRMLAASPEPANLDIEEPLPTPAVPVGTTKRPPKGRRRGQ